VFWRSTAGRVEQDLLAEFVLAATQRWCAPGRHRNVRLFRNAFRGTAVAVAMTVTVMAAGCTGGTPASKPTPAHPVAASGHPVAASEGPGARAASTFPPVFAASFPLRPAATGGSPGERIALLSSRTGDLLRWLTPLRDGVYDAVLSVHDGWVYFLRGVASVSTWRVPVAGGPAQLVQAGAVDYAVSPDGRAVAYVLSGLHLDVAEIVARNLVTGRQNTIIMATKPSPDANNWPPGISGLTWAPDDTHLAVQFSLTAAINSVLVFDAFTATTIRDGRTAPTPCTVTDKPVCGDLDPAYLASGALTYVIQQISSSGIASTSLVSWQAGHLRTLLSHPGGLPYMTPQGQAIWVGGPPQPGGPQTIWGWSGGAPVKITTLPPLGASPYYGVGSVAW
jgi:hypothetical protein